MGWKWMLWWGGMVIWHCVLVIWFPRLIWTEDFHVMDWAVHSHFVNALVITVTDLNVRQRKMRRILEFQKSKSHHKLFLLPVGDENCDIHMDYVIWTSFLIGKYVRLLLAHV